MKKVLILEDSAERVKAFSTNFINAEIIYTQIPIEAINHLKNEKFDYIFLDHDLGGTVYANSDENSGYAVAKWLEENPDRQPDYIILHSLNPTGVANMKQALPKAKIIPFVWTKIIYF